MLRKAEVKDSSEVTLRGSGLAVMVGIYTPASGPSKAATRWLHLQPRSAASQPSFEVILANYLVLILIKHDSQLETWYYQWNSAVEIERKLFN